MMLDYLSHFNFNSDPFSKELLAFQTGTAR